MLPAIVLLALTAIASTADPQTAPATSPPSPAVANKAERPWTLLIYGAADNNADGPILNFLDSIRLALDDDPGMAMVLFLDRSTGFSDDATSLGENFTGARLYELHKSTAQRLAGGTEFPEITLDGEYEANSADPKNLQKFLAWGKAHYPARRYGLLIYSHANGQTMCPDEASHRDMGIAEVTDVVSEKESVDFLALELCNMGGIEVAYQWRPGNGGFSANTLVAIPNAGPPLDWNRAFARIRSPGHKTTANEAALDPATMTDEQFARLVIEEGEMGRREAAKARPERAAHEAAACFDLQVAEDVKRAVDAFAVAIARSNGKDALEELRGPDTHAVVMNYVGDQLGAQAFVDLHDLCRRAAACERLDAASREAARQVMDEVDQFVIASFGMSAYKDFSPGQSGVAITFPDGDAPRSGPLGNTRIWADCVWYSPNPGNAARNEYGRWAWCRDGATEGNGVVENWFELLDSWFDQGDGGGLNGYRP